MRLKGKVAVVTGVGNKLAQTIALRIASEGAKVVLTDEDKAKTETLKELITKGNGEAMALEVDITHEESTQAMVQKVIDQYGTIDILVNSAVMFPKAFQPIEKWSAEDWDKIMAYNIKGAFLCVKAVAGHMKRQKSGKIINFTTSKIFSGQPMMLPYVTTRGAVYIMTRCLARELGDWNICVNTVSVSYIPEMEGAAIKDFPSDFADTMIMQQAFRRSEQPEDVVGTVVFLCSQDSDFFTGQLIACDGALVVH